MENLFLQRVVFVLSSILLAIASYYFFKGWFNIIPWAIAAILIGYVSSVRKNTVINGALFGYFLFITYILIGYKGKTDETSIIKFVLFTICFSLIGSVGGVTGALLGNFLYRKLKRYNEK